jgi:hypothetical protein
MTADPPDIPLEALAAARLVVDALHERMAALSDRLAVETPMAADLGGESES